MDVENKEGIVNLVSKDGEKFIVPCSVANVSELVKCMMDMEESSDQVKEIPLLNVKAIVLQKVIEFCEHHVQEPMTEIEKPLRSQNMADAVQQWYADYINVEQALLFELNMAANYMDIKPLLDLTCATVASMIMGKTPEEIRQTFNILNDFSPEEEAQVREENRWAFNDISPEEEAQVREENNLKEELVMLAQNYTDAAMERGNLCNRIRMLTGNILRVIKERAIKVVRRTKKRVKVGFKWVTKRIRSIRNPGDKNSARDKGTCNQCHTPHKGKSQSWI